MIHTTGHTAYATAVIIVEEGVVFTMMDVGQDDMVPRVMQMNVANFYDYSPGAASTARPKILDLD